MRRPNVYQRSAPRARRDVEHETDADFVPPARAASAALPDLLRQAEAAGAAALSRYLGQALTEAERIVRRAPTTDDGNPPDHTTDPDEADRGRR